MSWWNLDIISSAAHKEVVPLIMADGCLASDDGNNLVDITLSNKFSNWINKSGVNVQEAKPPC